MPTTTPTDGSESGESFPFGALSPVVAPLAWQQILGKRVVNPVDVDAKRRLRNPRVKWDKVRYVDHCRHDRATKAFWRKDDPSKLSLQPMRCKSWRHKNSSCSEAWGRQAFCRIRDAFNKLGEGWVFLVLGFRLNPNGSPSYIPKDPEEAYRALHKMGIKFRKRLKRHYACKLVGRSYVQHETFQYVEVVERHRSGFPHNNLAVYCPSLYAAVKGDGWKTEKLTIQRMKVECGFGEHMEAESPAVRSQNAIAGYMSKLISQEPTSMAGELAKSYQIPDNAPVHFRRLRASRGLLPPPATSTGEYTGVYVGKPVDAVVNSLTLGSPKIELPEIVIEEPKVDIKARALADAKAKAEHLRALRAAEVLAAKLANREAG